LPRSLFGSATVGLGPRNSTYTNKIGTEKELVAPRSVLLMRC